MDSHTEAHYHSPTSSCPDTTGAEHTKAERPSVIASLRRFLRHVLHWYALRALLRFLPSSRQSPTRTHPFPNRHDPPAYQRLKHFPSTSKARLLLRKVQ